MFQDNHDGMTSDFTLLSGLKGAVRKACKWAWQLRIYAISKYSQMGNLGFLGMP